MHKRFLLCPGWVNSKHDGQRHYVDAINLAHAYGLSMKTCEVRKSGVDGEMIESHGGYRHLIRLEPRSNGDYEEHLAWLMDEDRSKKALQEGEQCSDS